MRWAIFYSELVFTGSSRKEWLSAPDDDVQVVVVYEPPPTPKPDRFLTGYVGCGDKERTFYTGVDSYDPLGYGVAKGGRLLEDTHYQRVWGLACGNKSS